MLRHCTRGGVAPMMAVTMAAVIAMGALAVEASGWYATKRELQRIADAAAIQGAFLYRDTESVETALRAAAAVAVSAGAAGGTVTYDATGKTATSGEVTAKLVDVDVGGSLQSWIQVSLSRNHQNSAGAMFASHTLIGASGSANVGESGATPCILGLNSTGTSVNLNGSPTVTVSGCSIKSNGDFDTGGNSAVITADGLYTDGSFKGQGTTNSSDIKSANQVTETADPYLDNNYFAACDVTSNFTGAPPFTLGNGSTQTFAAAKGTKYYLSSGGDAIQGALTLDAGTHIVKGNVKVMTSGSIKGEGVNLIVCGNIDASATSVIDLSAPASNDGYGFPGLAIAANGSGTSTLNGGNNTVIDGLVYVPNGTLTFSGHSDTGGGGCLQLVAGVVTIAGSSSFGSSCSGFALENPDSGVAQIALTQ